MEDPVIFEVRENKRQYLDLLLLADEQESMVNRYLDRGILYALGSPEVRAVCVVTDEGNGVLELKNPAVAPNHQRQGLGRSLIEFLLEQYQGRYHTLLAGTGDSPMTLPFYERCGFRRSHVIPNFFIDHYDHPIFEDGVQLRDMICLVRGIPQKLPEQK